MVECHWTPRVERWFDGESAEAEAVEQHLAACDTCTQYLRQLHTVRNEIAAVMAHSTIEDPQFPAFMEGIREQIERPRGHRRGFWALASVTAAAVLVALGALILLTGGPGEVLATEVESYSTELEGATVSAYTSEDGSATISVSMPEEDFEL